MSCLNPIPPGVMGLTSIVSIVSADFARLHNTSTQDFSLMTSGEISDSQVVALGSLSGSCNNDKVFVVTQTNAASKFKYVNS